MWERQETQKVLWRLAVFPGVCDHVLYVPTCDNHGLGIMFPGVMWMLLEESLKMSFIGGLSRRIEISPHSTLVFC